jgi:hypothetical protein
MLSLPAKCLDRIHTSHRSIGQGDCPVFWTPMAVGLCHPDAKSLSTAGLMFQM